MSSHSIFVVTVDAEDCNVHEQRCEIRRSQKNRGIVHCFGFNYLFEHFKQPTPLGRFDNLMKTSKVIYIPKIMLPLMHHEK
jgi:hypothetical protein